jgi:hypothetical protein
LVTVLDSPPRELDLSYSTLILPPIIDNMVLSFEESSPNMNMSSITMLSLSANARGYHSNLRPTIDNS